MSDLRHSADTLRARIAEHHDVLGVSFFAVICDRCHCSQIATPPPGEYADDAFYDFCERVFAGWELGGYGENHDYCPRCQ